jgi:hypothetical protein
VELTIAILCLFMKNGLFSLYAVAWISSMILTYRLGVWVVGWHQPCHCLGNFTDVLHITNSQADFFMKCILYYLFGGSVILIYHAKKISITNKYA